MLRTGISFFIFVLPCMGGRHNAAWTWRVVLVFVAAVSACFSVAAQSRPSWTGSARPPSVGTGHPFGTLHAPTPAKARTLLVLTVNITEPVDDFLECTFQAHLPSVANIALDVFVAFSGDRSADDQRKQTVFEMIKQAVSNVIAAQPAFYEAPMLPAADPRGDVAQGTHQILTAAGLLAFLDDPRGQRPYDHAVIMDSQVCAVRVGWLDVALAPVLRNPKVLLSGAPLQNTCNIWSNKSTPGCRQNSSHADPMAGILSLRVSGQGRELLGHAKQYYGNLLITEAILAAARDRDVLPADAIFVNPRLLALHAPMDATLFKDAAYYGMEARLALVHAPRWLGVPGPVALAARLDLRPNTPTIAIVLPLAGVPDMQSLITSTWASFINAGIPAKNVVFLVCSRQGLIEASSLAAFQVLMMTTRPSGQAGPCSGVAVLEATASLVRAGARSMLLVGLDAAATWSLTAALKSLRKSKMTPVIYLQPGAEAPMQAPESPTTSPMNAGVMYINSPPDKVNMAGSALSAWAAALAKQRQLSRLSLEAVLSPMVTVSTLPETEFAWGGNRRFFAALQNGDARASNTAIVYSTGFVSSSMAAAPGAAAIAPLPLAPLPLAPLPLADWAANMVFRHRMAGLWNAGPRSICATYSAVSRKPLLLDNMRAVCLAVRRVAAFMVFARKHQLDCAAFPGFVLGGPHGPFVPFDAVLDGTAIRALAGPGLVLYPRVTDMDATTDGFVPFRRQRGRKLHRRHETGLHERPHRRGTTAPTTWLEDTEPTTTKGSFSVFGWTGTDAAAQRVHPSTITSADQTLSFLARSLVMAVQDKAAIFLSGGSFALVCAHDDRRLEASDIALLALDGGIAPLVTQLARLSGGRPVFLTGAAWRQAAVYLNAELETAGVPAWAPGFQILGAADFDLDTDSAGAGGPSEGGSSWAPIIEFVVCTAAAAATRLPAIDSRSDLVLSRLSLRVQGK